jgi:hypothetical protein
MVVGVVMMLLLLMMMMMMMTTTTATMAHGNGFQRSQAGYFAVKFYVIGDSGPCQYLAKARGT